MAASAVASAAGWAAVVIIGRAARHPRRAWVITGLAALALSMAAPLAGHGVTASQRLALAGMHVAVAVILIPLFAVTIPSRRGAGDAPAAPDSAAVLSRSRQAA